MVSPGITRGIKQVETAFTTCLFSADGRLVDHSKDHSTAQKDEEIVHNEALKEFSAILKQLREVFSEQLKKVEEISITDNTNWIKQVDHCRMLAQQTSTNLQALHHYTHKVRSLELAQSVPGQPAADSARLTRNYTKKSQALADATRCLAQLSTETQVCRVLGVSLFCRQLRVFVRSVGGLFGGSSGTLSELLGAAFGAAFEEGAGVVRVLKAAGGNCRNKASGLFAECIEGDYLLAGAADNLGADGVQKVMQAAIEEACFRDGWKNLDNKSSRQKNYESTSVEHAGQSFYQESFDLASFKHERDYKSDLLKPKNTGLPVEPVQQSYRRAHNGRDEYDIFSPAQNDQGSSASKADLWNFDSSNSKAKDFRSVQIELGQDLSQTKTQPYCQADPVARQNGHINSPAKIPSYFNQSAIAPEFAVSGWFGEASPLDATLGGLEDMLVPQHFSSKPKEVERPNQLNFPSARTAPPTQHPKNASHPPNLLDLLDPKAQKHNPAPTTVKPPNPGTTTTKPNNNQNNIGKPRDTTDNKKVQWTDFREYSSSSDEEEDIFGTGGGKHNHNDTTAARDEGLEYKSGGGGHTKLKKW